MTLAISHKEPKTRYGMLRRNRQLVTLTACPQCGYSLDKTPGQNGSSITYCKECGLVPTVTANTNNEKKVKNSEVSETGAALNKIDSEKTTPKTISQMWRDYSKPSDQTEKNFALTLAEIIRIAHTLSVEPRVSEHAAGICKRAFEKGLSRGRALAVLAAAAVYASAKLEPIPITVEEVASKSGLEKSDIIHCFRKLQRKLNLTFPEPSLDAYALKMLDLLSLHADAELITAAMNILERAERDGAAQGRNPAAVAAAAIYAASLKTSDGHYNLTQRKLAQAASVTETTIRRVCQSLDLQAPQAVQKPRIDLQMT